VITQQIGQKAEVIGVQANKFNFEMNAKMYDILISKLYSNKPGAVIRELSANAWDSHVEAGKADTPFDLHLPTWLDKSFYIRDYGTGIPHDKFEHIYTNVGASTKEDTNELIGSFGLGSKVSFTMTDTFMVENWYSGRKTTWICFKDKGEPQVSMVADESSDEPSGLKVSFSFDEGDVPEFTNQVVKQLRFFPVKPKITGGEGSIRFEDMPDGWDTGTYFYRKGDDTYYHRSSYVVMGNVAYDLDSSQFDYSLRDVFSRGLIIKVPIGAVDIPPSREHLEMTPRTKAYIVSVVETIKKDYSDNIQKKLDKCKNDMDVRKVVYDINHAILKNTKDLRWKGQEIDWMRFRNTKVSNVAGYSVKGIVRRYANVYRSSSINMRSFIDKTTTFYVNDLGTGFSRHINDNHHAHDVNHMVIFHVDGLTKKDKDSKIAKARAKLKAELRSDIKLLSEVFGFPDVVLKASTNSNRSEPNQVYKLNSGFIHLHTSLKSQMTEQTDLPKDGYYLELTNWSINKSDFRARECLDKGLQQFLDKPVYAVRTKTIPKLDKSMIPLNKDTLKSLKKEIKLRHKEASDTLLLKRTVSNVHPCFEPLMRVLKDRKLAAYMRYSYKAQKKTVDVSPDRMDNLYALLFDVFIEYEAKVPDKILKLSNKFKPYAEIGQQIMFGFNPRINKERMESLVKIIKDNQ